MRYFTLHRKLAAINLFVLFVLIADNFLLPVTPIKEIYDQRYSIETHGTRHGVYFIDYIKCVSGDEVWIPSNWQNENIGLNQGDSFYLYKSCLLRLPESLCFKWKAGFAKMNLTVLNNGYWGLILTIYILIVSLMQFLPWMPISKKYSEQFNFLGSLFMLVLLFLVFYH